MLKFKGQNRLSRWIVYITFPLVPRDCADVYKSGRHKSGMYTIDPDGEGTMEVFCDQVSTGFHLWDDGDSSVDRVLNLGILPRKHFAGRRSKEGCMINFLQALEYSHWPLVSDWNDIPICSRNIISNMTGRLWGQNIAYFLQQGCGWGEGRS